MLMNQRSFDSVAMLHYDTSAQVRKQLFLLCSRILCTVCSARMIRLNAFAYADDNNALHLDVPAMLKAMNIDDTNENRELLTKWAVEYFHRTITGTLCIVTDQPSQR
jgi:hypothetical protein